MIAAGLLLPTAVLLGNPNLLASASIDDVERLLGQLLLIALGGLLLLAGLVTNAVRAVIVRGQLAPERYRGPAVVVLLLLALIVGTVVALGSGETALALLDGGDLSILGTLILLTSTQIGLLTVTGALIVAPKALAGLRLTPPSGAARSMLIGLALAVPAWVAATVLAAVAAIALEAIGFTQEAGVADTVLARGDPTVVLVAFIVVAPAAEELFFRGVVYNAWLRERGPRIALFGSAALFAIIHTSLFALVPIFALGVSLAIVYRRTGSLLAAMAMHAGFNAISVGITLLDRLGILSLPT
ncbi:MAG: CPBP family intramembrane glutamic endopeptidase [Chloroflexota bacterium]